MAALAKIAGLVVAGVAIAILIAGGAIYVLSERRLNQTVNAPVESLAIPTDIAAVQHGQHLASAIAMCSDCHGSNMAGRVVLNSQMARIAAPNLTRGVGGVGNSLSDADVARAIRYGVDPSGRPLLLMPSDAYNNFGDADLAAMIAYIRSLPAVNTALPSNEVRTIGRVLFATGQLPLVPSENIDRRGAPRPPPPQPGTTAAYGQYVAQAAGCPRCHGPGLSGGALPGATQNSVPAANITPAALGDWSQTDFLRAMRTGRRPDGRVLDSSMPWPYFAQMTEVELRALWEFLKLVPPRPSGTR